MNVPATAPRLSMATMPIRYGVRSTSVTPASAPPPIGSVLSAAVPGASPWRSTDQCPSARMQGMVASRSSIDSMTSPAVPNPDARDWVNSGPMMAPALPPAAIGPNSRLASSPRKTSAMKLQKTDTTNMLKTLSQTKNVAAVLCEPGSALNAR